MDWPPPNIESVACLKMQREILLRLLRYCDDIDDWPWRPIEEVIGSTAEPITALDALAALADNGLILRKGEFVMAAKIAYGFYQLVTWEQSGPVAQLDLSGQAHLPSAASRNQSGPGTEGHSVPGPKTQEGQRAPMPDIQPTQTDAEHDAHVDWAILDVLTEPQVQRPWSPEELARELEGIGEAGEIADGTYRLYTAGLIHRTTDGFVFATRAALRYAEVNR